MKELKEFIIRKNDFLQQDILGYYHKDYIRFGVKSNPDFLLTLKNWHRDKKEKELIKAKNKAKKFIYDILKRLNKDYIICVIPRLQKQTDKDKKQNFFRKAVREVLEELKRRGSPIIDGMDFIQRHTNVEYGDLYNYDRDFLTENNITLKTCDIDEYCTDRNIILINDIYTDIYRDKTEEHINIVEDCIQALLSKGANSVGVYCIAKTKECGHYEPDESCVDPYESIPYEYKNCKPEIEMPVINIDDEEVPF